MIIYGYVDAKTAFLYGDLHEEIKMKCPPCLKTKRNQILVHEKCIYGLVKPEILQKKTVTILKK